VELCAFQTEHHRCVHVLTMSFVFSVTLCAEFMAIARATSLGFLIMGFVGFFVKLVHIPINNIIVGGI